MKMTELVSRISRCKSTLTGTAGGPSAAFSPAPELPSDGALLFAPSVAEDDPAAAADSDPSPADSVFAFFGSGSPEDVDGPAAKAALSASAFLANSSLWKKDDLIVCSKNPRIYWCFVHSYTDDARLPRATFIPTCWAHVASSSALMGGNIN